MQTVYSWYTPKPHAMYCCGLLLTIQWWAVRAGWWMCLQERKGNRDTGLECEAPSWCLVYFFFCVFASVLGFNCWLQLLQAPLPRLHSLWTFHLWRRTQSCTERYLHSKAGNLGRGCSLDMRILKNPTLLSHHLKISLDRARLGKADLLKHNKCLRKWQKDH